MFGGKLIGHNDPDYQEKVIKFNELIANRVIYSTACDITDAANEIASDGEPVDPDDLATIAPYITHTVRRFGNWVINLTPPEDTPTTRLDLEPRVLFRAARHESTRSRLRASAAACSPPACPVRTQTRAVRGGLRRGCRRLLRWAPAFGFRRRSGQMASRCQPFG
jgi:hypothetical protein